MFKEFYLATFSLLRRVTYIWQGDGAFTRELCWAGPRVGPGIASGLPSPLPSGREVLTVALRVDRRLSYLVQVVTSKLPEVLD